MPDNRYNDETSIKGFRFRDTRRLRSILSEAAPTQPSIVDPNVPRIPVRLRFQLADSETMFIVDIKKYMVIGRRGDSHDQQVHIDFKPYGAKKHGVSRYHAVLIATEDGITIKDVNSTNGTRLNGRLLEPLQSYLLKHGDELLLGSLRVSVCFLGDPPPDEAHPS